MRLCSCVCSAVTLCHWPRVCNDENLLAKTRRHTQTVYAYVLMMLYRQPKMHAPVFILWRGRVECLYLNTKDSNATAARSSAYVHCISAYVRVLMCSCSLTALPGTHPTHPGFHYFVSYRCYSSLLILSPLPCGLPLRHSYPHFPLFVSIAEAVLVHGDLG